MSRPQQVRAVFQELRQALGDQFSAGELLERAAALVSLLMDEDDSLYSERMTDRISFEERDLCEAMADGGWSVLNHVYEHDYDLYDWQAFQ